MFERLISEMATQSSAELDEIIAEAELARRSAETRLAAAAAVIASRGSFRDDGHRSMRSYLKGTLNCSGAQATRIRRRADLLNHHAAVGEALMAGHIGIDQVDRLAGAHAHPRAGGQFADFAPLLLDAAEQLEFDDFDTAVKHFINQADADGAFDTQRFHEEHRTASVREADGIVSVFASGGDPQAAVEMARIFELAVQAEVERDFETRRADYGDDALAHPLPRNDAQRKFDALHQIFMSWATVPAGGTTPEPLVNIVIDHVSAGHLLAGHGLSDGPNLFDIDDDVFATTEADLTNRRCQTTTGSPVHADVALRAMITGRIRRAVVDAESVVIDFGRTKRLFTGRARDAAQLLVTSCTHRGCDVPATLCDVDHRLEWNRDHGRTDQANAMPLCGSHDRWKHANSIRSRRAANGRLYLIRPDGSTILPVGAREPAWAESSPHRAEAA